MGIEVEIEGLSKSFGRQNIWRDLSFTVPEGEISALLGPSGTGKSVFLKSMIGLLKPERGRCVVDGVDIVSCSEHKLYETRKKFGVLFQDGALFGSMNLFDNVAFPLREHTKKSETEIKRIVLEKLELVGLSGAEGKLPGEISGGMRKRAGLARGLVLDPQILLCDEPDSGLDPVRTAYLSQTLIDLNAQTDATILVVTHNINVARTLPDNLGMLFRRELVMFGPREVLLTSDEPVVDQFLNGKRIGPIGMSEEKDTATMAAEQAMVDEGQSDGSSMEDMRGIVPQIEPTPGLPERKAERRRKDRVMKILHTLPQTAQHGIIESLSAEERNHYGVGNAPTGPTRAGDTQQFAAGGQQAQYGGATQTLDRPSPTPRAQGGTSGYLPERDVATMPESGWQPDPAFRQRTERDRSTGEGT
ncbi:MAG: ABC transporter ATP-binding protein [Sciscionella sp.]